MMDYLTQLAARSLGQAPVLRPRLPSRFEPVEPAASPWENEPETPDAPRLPAKAASFDSNATSQEQSDQSTAHPESPSSGHRQPPDNSGETGKHDTVTRGLVPREPSEGAVHPGARRPEPPPAPAVSATIHDAAASFIVAEHSIPPQSGAPPQPAPAPMSPPSASRRAIPPDSPNAPSRTSPSSPSQTDRVQERATRNDIPASARRSSEAPAKPDPNAGGPAIRITIGRVEIRAVSQGTKDRRPRPAPGPPVLSLEDYLKERKARLK